MQYTGKYGATPNVSKATDRKGATLKKEDIDTIEALDAVIARNTLPFPVRLIRNLDIDAVINIFGLPTYCLSVADVEHELGLKQNVSMRPDCGYMSSSAISQANLFTYRDCCLEVVVPQGVNLYITDNANESECILGREVRLQYLSHNIVGSQLIIKCEVQP